MPRPAPARTRVSPADPGTPLHPSAASVLRRFRMVFGSVRNHFREVEKKAGLAGAQVWALSVVDAAPGIGVTALARTMDIHQSTASNLIKPLIAQGLLRTERSQTDGRSRALFLTADGRRVLKRVPGPFMGVLPQALLALDRTTLSRLDRDLGRLVEVMGADGRGEQTPLGAPER